MEIILRNVTMNFNPNKFTFSKFSNSIFNSSLLRIENTFNMVLIEDDYLSKVIINEASFM